MLKKVGGFSSELLLCLCSWFVFIFFLCCGSAGFGESGDPSCVIMQIWARIEVSVVTMTTIFKRLTSAVNYV